MRLIDADKVLEFMRSKLEMQDLYLPVHLKELVTDEMPTAYDIDKVIEQLREELKQFLIGQRKRSIGHLERLMQGKPIGRFMIFTLEDLRELVEIIKVGEQE